MSHLFISYAKNSLIFKNILCLWKSKLASLLEIQNIFHSSRICIIIWQQNVDPNKKFTETHWWKFHQISNNSLNCLLDQTYAKHCTLWWSSKNFSKHLKKLILSGHHIRHPDDIASNLVLQIPSKDRPNWGRKQTTDRNLKDTSM